jgi:hypothetical protein
MPEVAELQEPAEQQRVVRRELVPGGQELQATELQATELQATELQATELQAPELQATELQAPERQAPELQAALREMAQQEAALPGVVGAPAEQLRPPCSPALDAG